MALFYGQATTVFFGLLIMAVFATANLNYSRSIAKAKPETEAFLNNDESPLESKQRPLNYVESSASHTDYNQFVRHLKNVLKELHKFDGIYGETLPGSKEENHFGNEQVQLIRTLLTLLHYNRTTLNDNDLPRGRSQHAGRKIKTNVNILTDPSYTELIISANLILGLAVFLFLIAVFIADASVISKEAWTRSNAIAVKKMKKQQAEAEIAKASQVLF